MMFKKAFKRQWWSDRFVTVMIVPERTRRVHRLAVPFFMIKLGAVLAFLTLVFLVVVGVDYIQVLRGQAEHKRLKGENFKLRRELQLVQNKVDSLEGTLGRVRDYAKKLQILTGQEEDGDSVASLPWQNKRTPAAQSKENKKKSPDSGLKKRVEVPEELDSIDQADSGEPEDLSRRVASLEQLSEQTEFSLSKMQGFFLAKQAIFRATPSITPLKGWLSSPYGYRRHPLDGSYRLHAGVDIAAESGTPVRSPADGQVIYSGYRRGYGKVIVVDHGYGITTLFGHNSKLFVNVGLQVKRGQVLAEVGSTGRSTAPHLHYEVRKNGKPVNPASFLGRQF